MSLQSDSAIVDQQSGANNLNVNTMVGGFFDLGKTALTGYFAEETAKNALHAPTSNTLVVVGGIVVIGVLLYMMFKH
jgi:hypothetical protein